MAQAGVAEPGSLDEQGIGQHSGGRLVQRDFESEEILVDKGRAERSLRDHVLELGFGVGAFEEHEAKGEFGDEAVHGAETHGIDGLVDGLFGGITAQIDDEGFAAATENTIDLIESLLWLGEILEGSAAKNEIEGFGGEGHGGSVAATKFDGDVFFGGINVRDFNEGLADVEAGDFVAAQFG